MVDVVDKATRSRMMSGIRGKNTAPELIVRSFLHRAGLRFRIHAKLPGKPDLVLPKYKTAVFVHGCFWHRHKGCRFSAEPSSNASFWRRKFEANIRRDRAVKVQLRQLGWHTRVVWSCQLSDEKLATLAERIKSASRQTSK